MSLKVRQLFITLPFEGSTNLLIAEDLDYSQKILGSLRMIERTGAGSPPVVVVHFASLFVAEFGRRRGVGRALLARAEELARSLPAESISCYVKPGNLEAIKFYEALGYNRATIFDDGDFIYSKKLMLP